MIFDQSLQAYVHEVDNVLVAWEENQVGVLRRRLSCLQPITIKIGFVFLLLYCLIYKNFTGI